MSSSLFERFPWTRLWCPWETPVKYDHDGFVLDPESEYGRTLNPDLTTLDALQDQRCLILLGEPGLGKTEALRDHYQNIKEAKKPPDLVMWVDLKDFVDAYGFSRQVFDSIAFKEWEWGNGRLYLFLDSLDEGLLAFDSLSGFITQELHRLARPSQFKKAQSAEPTPPPAGSSDMTMTVEGDQNIPLTRLYLRISCRSAIWRPGFAKDLEGLFEQNHLPILRLAPLRRRDVELAAESAEANDFVEQVIARKVVPFAVKPFTLKALLSLFRQEKTLPPQKLTIYSEVCRVACIEHNKSRKEKLRLGQLNSEERLKIARRIAALSVFCNKSTIRTDFPAETLEVEELGVDVIYGNEDEVRIDAHTLRETLDTALFAWGSEHRVSWDHRIFSEFLAAEYCKLKMVSVRDVSRLIFVEALGQRRVAQQLYETTAWLCLFYPSLVKTVVKNDPAVLLLSDVLKDDEKIRFAVTERYLLGFEREEHFNDQLQTELALLSNPRLSEQLRPYIADRKKNIRARIKAMDIAEECLKHDLEPYLIKVARDKSETVAVRVHALVVLERFGTSQSKQQLRELIRVDRNEDPNDEIKGWALRAVWPDHISVEELFSVLSRPEDTGFYGGYYTFLHSLRSTLPSHLEGEDLLTAMRWVEGLFHGPDRRDRLQSIGDCILIKAWEQLENPSVLEAFTAIALKRIQLHAPIAEGDLLGQREHGYPFYQLLSKDPEKRRLVSRSLIRQMATSAETESPFLLLYCPDQIIRPADTGWLIEQLALSTAKEKQVILSNLERMSDAESLVPIRAGLDSGILPESLRSLIYVDLASSLAATLRHQYQEMRHFESRRHEPLVPPPSERISKLLQRIDQGEVAFWSHLTLTLTLEPDSRSYGDEAGDLRRMPGWLASDQQTKNEIVAAAKQFLLHFAPIPKEYSQQTFGHWIIAAYLAFVLLHAEDLAFLQSQEEEFWNRWSGLLISYRFDHQKELSNDLLSFVAGRFPVALIKGLNEIFVPELTDCYFLSRLEDAWIPEVQEALVGFLKAGTLNLSCSESVLNILLAHGVSDAETIAETMIQQTTDPEKQIMASAALLKSSADGGQQLVLPLIKSSEELGKKVVERISEVGANVTFASKWSEAAVGELFIWLAKRYPYSKDSDFKGGWVGAAESVRFTRDALLTNLRNRGTAEAIAALDRAKKELGADWLKWHIGEAKTAAFWNAWNPISPPQLLGLVRGKADIAPRWQVFIAGLSSYIVNLLTPASASIPTRLCLSSCALFLILGLLELTRRDKPWLYPLWFLISLLSLIGLLFYHFIGF